MNKPKYLKVDKSKNGVYVLSGTINGQRLRKSTYTKDKDEAYLIALRMEVELLCRAINGTHLNPTLEESVKRYEKNVKYDRKNQGIVNRIARYFEGFDLLDIDQDAVDQFIQSEFLAKGMEYSTAHRNVTILNAIRNHAVKSKMVSADSLPYLHVEQPSKHDHRMSVVDEATRDRIIQLARPPYGDVFIFLFYSGARIGCALNRTWQHREAPGLRLYTVKGGRSKLRQRREYHVPEVPELTTMLDRRLTEAQTNPDYRKSERIFNISDTAVRDELARVCGILGVEDFLPHDIRHCFGTYLANNGFGIEAIADLMGHDSLESTRIYINHANEDLKSKLKSALSRGKPTISGGTVVSLHR